MKKEIEISQNFKNQAKKAIISIVVFLFVYLLIVFLCIALAVICVFGAITMVISKPHLITIALGIGLASLGVLVFFFIIKFLFKSNKKDLSHLTEIHRTEQPELFKLIDNLVEEIGTPFPKKVYLSPEVTAAVFYDSSFWSMFFPIKKNLQIGLGLINTITEIELKAILAHEFGHFSQKSMKVGSYVHNFNQIIFNMLYDNDSFDKAARSWGETSNYFAIFVMIGLEIVKGIQWVLKQLYNYLNKSYMALSREMEFHADTTAASITGYKPLKDSLLRLDLAEVAFNGVLSHYDSKVIDNIKSKNIYAEQSYLVNFLAKKDKIEIKNGLPFIKLNDLNRYNKSKLNIEDQWASHPTIEQRVKNLEATDFKKEIQNFNLAGNLFRNLLELQEKLTEKIFNDIKYEAKPVYSSLENFAEEIQKTYIDNTFPEIYNGYYDNKNPVKFDIEKDFIMDSEVKGKDLFSSESVHRNYIELSLKNDLEILNLIKSGEIKIKTFDYDGEKYSKKDLDTLINNIKKELEVLEQSIKNNDIRIYKYCEKVSTNPQNIKALYKNLIEFDGGFDNKMQIYYDLLEKLDFISQNTPYDEIKSKFLRIEPLETKLKEELKSMLDDALYTAEINAEMRKTLSLYTSEKLQYFGKQTYFDNNLQTLFAALNSYEFLVSRGYFILKKELLDYQAKILSTNKELELS
ncbi:M48 family metalloprotease [Polaribacter butkevichii]|uniref:Peptidase M48 domain-containing protein n=1 Tax=Polaribacter butkevichii TaxID=218490 RepID=A0A2P6C9S1_9FLAO|nr:M48 family metallopeptidase [Polaribacter butkevichii]PQJ69693.1 hypothetical protein BTO14_11700 [Polaribacter butkevichii]